MGAVAPARAGLTAGHDVQLFQAGAVDALLTALLNGDADGAMLGSAQHFIAGSKAIPCSSTRRTASSPVCRPRWPSPEPVWPHNTIWSATSCART